MWKVRIKDLKISFLKELKKKNEMDGVRVIESTSQRVLYLK